MRIPSAGYTFGAYVVAVECHSEEEYYYLPLSIQHGGYRCAKYSYNRETNRAFYRSNVEAVVPQRRISHVLRMSDEELIAAGYLTIEQRGRMKSYRPTAKYQALLRPQSPTVVQSSAGIRTLTGSHTDRLLQSYLYDEDLPST